MKLKNLITSKEQKRIDIQKREKLIIRGQLITYCTSFQEYDMDKLRDLEEIWAIVNSIPHNQGLTRNGIIFKGSFDSLLEPATMYMLKDCIFQLKQNYEGENKLLSLSEYLTFVFNK